jgi:hypothetical protein
VQFGRLLSSLGHDPAVLDGLNPWNVRSLGLCALASLCSASVLAVSAGYALRLSYLREGEWSVWPTLTGVGVFAILLLLLRLSVISRPISLWVPPAGVRSWRPRLLRSVLIVAIALVGSQPVLLWLNGDSLEPRLQARLEDGVLAQRAVLSDVLRRHEQTLLVERSALQEHLATLAADATGATGVARVLALPAGDGRRKALLIGAQSYRYLNPLANPGRDVAGLASELRRLGFMVTISLDESAGDINLKIHRYMKSLRPGDISLIYYSGHGAQEGGHNYMLPVDYRIGDLRGAIRITPLLEYVDRTAPRLQVLILDACREVADIAGRGVARDGGLAQLEGGTNSFVAMAAQPGKLALDGEPGGNSPFTGAILSHIGRAEDINQVFRRVTNDVIDSTRRPDGTVQRPVVTSSLTESFVQLASPTLSRREPGPTRTLSDGSSIRTIAGCSVPDGFSSTDRQAAVEACLAGRLDTIDHALMQIEPVRTLAINEDASRYLGAMLGSGLLNERWRIMLDQRPIATVLWTLVLVLLLAGGDIYRDRLGSAIVAYEKRRYEQAEALVHRNFLRLSQAQDVVLRRLRHPDTVALAPLRTSRDWLDRAGPAPAWSAGVAQPMTEESIGRLEAHIAAVGSFPDHGRGATS